MQTAGFALLVLAGCAGAPAAPVAPAAVLGEAAAAAAPAPLDGPYGSLEEAPAPLGAAPVPLLAVRRVGPVAEAALVELRVAGGAAPSRCRVALRLADGWYVAPTFSCEAARDDAVVTVEATAIEEVAGAPPGVVVRLVERTDSTGGLRREERPLRIDCAVPPGAAPACGPPRPDAAAAP